VEVAEGGAVKHEKRNVLILKEGSSLHSRKDADGIAELVQPTIYVAPYKTLGTIYAILLLCVIVATNVSIRGLWSVVVMVSVLALSLIFALAGWWEVIFQHLGQLSIYINLGGYLLISTVLFALWLVNFFLFDRQTYILFTPGQVRVRLEIGGGETVYDTVGMVVQKHRADLFRHWVLGFGSGDLTVRPHGVAHALEMPNVLRVGKVVKQIERMVKEKVVVQADGDRRV
jgi:hypothetical protein